VVAQLARKTGVFFAAAQRPVDADDGCSVFFCYVFFCGPARQVSKRALVDESGADHVTPRGYRNWRKSMTEDKLSLKSLLTEQRNPDTLDIDELPALEIVARINREDQRVPVIIGERLEEIAALVERIVEAFQQGGRLIYIGAGTSGRLGVLDASECPPTYGTDPGMVVGLIAGGDYALRNAVEGAEDDADQGRRDVQTIDLNPLDVLVGIAASGRTPYPLGAMRYAREIGAAVGCVVNSPGSPMEAAADYPVVIPVGPEVITGSTRMKAGSAQKMTLNMLTTAAMIRLGKVYSNLMVDVQPTNQKLIRRAIAIVTEATGVRPEVAEKALADYGSTKAAIFGLLTGMEGDEVDVILEAHGGRLKEALKAVAA
jgi:N-acetylmuramic acid 6-phosphate etherase